MKYQPKFYAQAFAELAGKKLSPAEEKHIVNNLLQAVKRNGDERQLPKILAAAEKLLREKDGRRKVVLESARPLHSATRKDLSEFLLSNDVVEEKINPALVAGVKVIVNDETQLDFSLASKLKKLFA